MFQFDFDYVILNLLLLLVFGIAGYNISKGGNFKKNSIWCIIFFVFILGSRYARGNDYIHYIKVYEYDLEKEQYAFTLFNSILKYIGVSAYGIFYVYAFPFITGGLCFLNGMRKYAKYLFPLFLLAFIYFEEFVIRQALGYSFVFLYIVQLRKIGIDVSESKLKLSRYIYAFVFACLAYYVHSVNAVTILLITVIFLFSVKAITWKVTIPLFIIGKFYFAERFDWSYLNNVLSFMASMDSKFASYAEQSDMWFSNDALNDTYTRNVLVQYLETIGNCTLLYLGYKTVSVQNENIKIWKESHFSYLRSNIYIWIFNVYAIGTISYQVFYNLEIGRRITNPLNYFWCVPLTMVLYYRKSKLFNPIERLSMFAFFFWIYEYIRYLFVRGDMTMFLWDL